MPRVKISNEKRKLIVDAYNRGDALHIISTALDVKYETVRKVIRVYKESGRIEKLKKGHRPKKFTVNEMEQICDWVDRDCTVTSNELVRKCQDIFNKNVSRSTINRCLKDFHYTLKNVRLIPERRNSEDVIEQRYNYAIRFLEMVTHPERLFFLDETGIQIFSRVSRGRAPAGIHARKEVRQVRSQNVSICACMTNEEIVFFDKLDKAYNSEKFTDFLTRFIQVLLDRGTNHAFIVMDNVPFHKTEEVRILLAALGHEAIFLPPYSPFLNPIENLFNQWKQKIKRRQPSSKEELNVAINESVQEISRENCSNYFRNMQTYIPLCLRRQAIED